MNAQCYEVNINNLFIVKYLILIFVILIISDILITVYFVSTRSINLRSLYPPFFFFFFGFLRKLTDSLKLELGIKTTDLLNLNVKVDEYERINREILQENVLLKGKEEDHIKQVNIILRRCFFILK